jgi:hypothetical protein
MGLHYYNYLVLVAPESTITYEGLKQNITAFFAKHPQYEMKIEDLSNKYSQRFEVSIKSYKIYLSLDQNPDVAIESAEQSQYYNLPILATCQTRFDIYADDDLDDIHYDDHLMIMERFSDYQGTWILDGLLGKVYGKGAESDFGY